jgi:hypothetical protein
MKNVSIIMWLMKRGEEQCSALCLGLGMMQDFPFLPSSLLPLLLLFTPNGQEMEFSDSWMKMVQWWVGGGRGEPRIYLIGIHLCD